MIYLDNAATTYRKPRSVYKAVLKSIKTLSANPGRGAHDLSISAAKAVYATREEVCQLLNFPYPERVIFSLNATYALNLAIKGLIKEKCHVLLSDVEHNSVIRPIQKLKDNIGIDYSFFDSNAKSLEDELDKSITPQTKFIVSTLASNVTGKEIAIETLSKVAAERNLKLIIDASQYAGHKEIDLQKYPCSALCAPAHKALFGIMGLGFAVFDKDGYGDTLIEGGSGSMSESRYMPLTLPERFEGGTLPLPAIISLFEGIRYIKKIGYEEIEYKSQRLTELCSEMIGSLPKAKIYGNNLGIITFNIKDRNSENVAQVLNDSNICVRGGMHCAPTAHKKLGTEAVGAVRVSLSYFSTEQELYKLYLALKKSVI